MFSTNVTIFHHLISQAGWNRCNLSIYLSPLLDFLDSLTWSLFMSLSTHRLVLLCVDAYCFIFWHLPGDVLAAPEAATDVFHFYCILSCIPIDCSLILTFTDNNSCWPGLGSLPRRDVNPCLNCRLYTVTQLIGCNTLLWYLPGDVLAAPASALCGWKGVNSPGKPSSLHACFHMYFMSLVYLEFYSHPWSTCLPTYLSSKICLLSQPLFASVGQASARILLP